MLAALSAIPDPRNPRGVRYPLAALLTVAVCAVLAGASSFAAITDWLYDLDEPAQVRLGFPPVTFLIVPSRGLLGRPARYDFLPLSLMIRGVLSPGRVASADR
nr:transposase family protein [Micromonospora inyonensis]